MLAGFILVASLMGILLFAASRHLAAQEDEYKRVASARGWTFESTNEKGYRVHRWTGTTDRIPWVAEQLMQTGNKKRGRKRHIARWHGVWSPGLNGAIVAMGVPRGKEETGTTLAAGESFLAKMAQKAAGVAFDQAIDVYFGAEAGKDVDAGALHRLDGKTSGFIVMAADKEEGVRVLHEGLEWALGEASSDTSSVLSDEDRPWILLRPKAVSIARLERFRDINEIESFIRAGISLTRTSKFGRPVG